jgi:Phasin protein
MTMQSRSIPTDMPSLWDMNEQSLGNAETAMRAWFEISSRAQEHATKFMSSRWAKDTAALAQLGQCKTPVDALNVQMTHLTGACADYMNEGQKIVGFFGDVVRETLPGMSAEHAPSTSGKSKHSPHRVAAH